MGEGRAFGVLAIVAAVCLVTTTWIVARRAPEPPTAAPASATSDELQAARAQIARLQQEVAELSGKIAMLEARHGAGGISTPPPPPSPPRPPGTPLKGMVLAADAKAGVFLLSRGRKDGLTVADELTVYRGDQFVAVVVVDKVFEDKCSVTVKVEDGKPLLKAGMEIKQGDLFASVY